MDLPTQPFRSSWPSRSPPSFGWGESTRTLVPWRQGFRHPTKNECMGWFAQISILSPLPSSCSALQLRRPCLRLLFQALLLPLHAPRPTRGIRRTIGYGFCLLGPTEFTLPTKSQGVQAWLSGPNKCSWYF